MHGVDCVDCHMWTTPSVSRDPITDTIGGTEHHDHEFEATAEACADCHSTIMFSLPTESKPDTDIGEGEANYTLWHEWELFEQYWEREVDSWQKVIDSWQEDFDARWTEVNATLAAAYADLVAANSSGTIDQASLDKAFELYYNALWNLEFVEADGSEGVHNFDYAMMLLQEVEDNSETIGELITVQADGDPPAEEPTDYTTFFYVVIALLVVSMILSIVALMKKPQAPTESKPEVEEAPIEEETPPEKEEE